MASAEPTGSDKGVVLARHRDGTEERLTIKQATVALDFYDIGDGVDPDDALERWFDRAIENPIGELMAQLRKGTLPASEYLHNGWRPMAQYLLNCFEYATEPRKVNVGKASGAL